MEGGMMDKVKILKAALLELLNAIPPEVLRRHHTVGVNIYGHPVCGTEGEREFPKLMDRAMVARDIAENI
jgi:hypothetical protein